MKKKFAMLLVLALLFAVFAGCTYNPAPPYIKYVATGYSNDMDNVMVGVDDGHILSPGHPYDVVETDDGYDLVFHVVEITE